MTPVQAIFGLREDLDLNTGNRYSFASSIFYLGFICGATPAVVLAQRFPVERTAFGIVFVWGIVSETRRLQTDVKENSTAWLSYDLLSEA